MSKVVLVDGSSYLFRAFHALPHLTNSKGEPTGAMLGVLNMLRKLPEQHQTDYVAVVFDAKGKNFRHEIYPEYKANRKKMADELRVQIEPLHELVEKMGYPLICVPDVEADDVIGTLAKQLSKQGHQVIISTGDKDMAQLVDENITLVDTMKNEVTDYAHVESKFGVKPEQIIDYLALMGDSSDNIPGVPKVGPKTAVKWLAEYGSLQNVIDNADKVKGKVGESLRGSISFLPMSYQLATIKCDLELSYHLENLALKSKDVPFLTKAFEHYEFRQLLRSLENTLTSSDEPVVIDSNELDYKIIYNNIEFEQMMADLSQSDAVVFDLETDSLNTLEANIVGIAFSHKPYHAFYVPLRHDYEDAPTQCDYEQILPKLKQFFSNSVAKIAHNAKFDLKILQQHGITVENLHYDTMLESYVFNSAESRHDMDSLAKRYLNHTTTTFEEVAGKGKKQKTFNQIEITTAGYYACEDADITMRLHQYFWPQINNEPSLLSLYNNIELPICFVLTQIERIGVKIDCDFLAQQSDDLAQSLADIETKCFALNDAPFNLSSPKQLSQILFEKMGLPILKKTPGGDPSTAEEVLSELAESYELPRHILQYRHLSKLKSTYTDKLPTMIQATTGRVHTSYHQAVAITGRLSSSDPNLQNIPIRSEVGRKIRQAFIPSKGYKIMAADYSQVELRIMAHLSQDKTLVEAFKNNLDIHSATAAETMGIPLDQVTSEQRRRAKAVNFGLIYGMGAFGLAKQLNISRGEAQAYVDIYFERYPGVKAYMDEAKLKAKFQGYVETIMGRRLYLPDIKSRNMGRQKAAERAAINAPMQGTAADIIKMAMINIQAWINRETPPVKLIMQVHDELVFEVADDYVDQANQIINRLMVDALSLDVPLVVDIGVGENWDEAH